MRKTWSEPGFQGEHMRMWSPAIDVSERDDKLVVRADLPGMSKEDLKIEAYDNNLVILGERHQEQQEKQGGYQRSERWYGSFYRSIPLPEGTQTDKAHAEFKDGVLEVSVPVPATQRKGREIPIEAGTSQDRKDLASASARQTRVSKAG